MLIKPVVSYTEVRSDKNCINFAAHNAGNEPTKTFLGQTKLHTYWHWTVQPNNAQMELGALSELQMWSKGANDQSHTSFLPLVTPSKKDTRFGGSR